MPSNKHRFSSQSRHKPKSNNARSNVNGAMYKNRRMSYRNIKNHQTNKVKKIVNRLFEDSSSSSDDEPIMNRFNKNQRKNKTKSPLNRIPKYPSKRLTRITGTNTRNHIPQKRCNNNNGLSFESTQPRKKRKINNNTTNGNTRLLSHKTQTCISKRTKHSALKRPKRTNHKTETETLINSNKNVTINHKHNDSDQTPPPKIFQHKSDKTKPIKEPIIIDLLSDSEEDKSDNIKKHIQTSFNNNNKNKNMICFAHYKYSKAVSISRIPLHIFEHELVNYCHQKYNITVIQCDPFEKVTDTHHSFKKCNRFELLNTQQRNHLLDISKRGELKICNESIENNIDNDTVIIQLPPAPKLCPVYKENESDINIRNTSDHEIEMRLEMDLSAVEWVNKFAVFGCGDVTPLISAQEIIEIEPSDEIHIDNVDHKMDGFVQSEPLSMSLNTNNNNQFLANENDLMMNSYVNNCNINSNHKPWTFYLCVEEAVNTPAAQGGDIIPMIQVSVDKTRLKYHEKCEKMVWFQRKHEIATKYCEWIQNDILEAMFSECVDVRFITPHCDRQRKQLISFRRQLNKHNAAVFINPSIFDGEYYIGLKVLGVIEPFGGGTIIKSKIVKIAIPLSINHTSDMTFSACSPMTPSIPSTNDTVTI